jgi:apolipoprotein N-acyltransferase
VIAALERRAAELRRRAVGLAGWRRYALAAVAGGVAAAAMAPLHVLPALLVAFTVLAWLVEGSSGRAGRFFVAFAFAYGYFAAGLYWIGISFFVDAERFALLAPLPVLGMPLLLAPWPAAGVWLAGLVRLEGAARVLALSLGWTLGEYLRGVVLTGFPWNLVGYVWSDFDAMVQSGAWLGIHGVGMLTVALAAMPAALADGRTRAARWWCAGLAAVFVGLWLGGMVRLHQADAAGGEANVPGVALRLVQPNVDQRDKWRDERRAQIFDLLRQLSAGPDMGLGRSTLIVWPETAVPYLLEHDAPRRAVLGAMLPGNGLLLTGAIRVVPPGERHYRAWNSLLAIDPAGAVAATYDKRHLVPFGEFLPLRGLMSLVGLDRLSVGDVDFSPGVGPAVLNLAGLPPVRVLICYEAIFPAEIALPGEPRAAWLLNVTNDAWFGNSSGPYQHLAMARWRAVEQGVPLVRAANTGISAIVDAHGRVRASLALGTAGVIDGPLPAALDSPPLYARWGDGIALAMGLVLAAAAAATRRFAP